MLRENYTDQENPSPLRSMEHSFRAYTARRKAVEERRMSGNGLPDYAFSSDYEYRKRLDAIPHFYSVAKKICGTYASRTLQESQHSGAAGRAGAVSGGLPDGLRLCQNPGNRHPQYLYRQ